MSNLKSVIQLYKQLSLHVSGPIDKYKATPFFPAAVIATLEILDYSLYACVFRLTLTIVSDPQSLSCNRTIQMYLNFSSYFLAK